MSTVSNSKYQNINHQFINIYSSYELQGCECDLCSDCDSEDDSESLVNTGVETGASVRHWHGNDINDHANSEDFDNR